jgi:MSHA biogenesis protein MshI
MRLFSRPLAKTARTAIVHTSAAAVAAVVDLRPGAGQPRLLHLAIESRTRGALHWTAAQNLLKAMPHRETPVSALMPPGNYHLFQVDAPDVPAADMREAMRWKIRDLIDQPPETMAIDIFAMPPRPQLGTARQMFVVAAEQWRVDEQSVMVSAAARQLDVIDIPELALRNLMALVPGEAAGCALLVIARGFVQILISRGGNLYVVRKIDGSVAQDPERIGLDVQRSLQYYESHFDSIPITRLLVAPANDQAARLAPQLAAVTGLQVEALEVEKLLDCDGAFPQIDQPESLLALGAALRPPTAVVQ